MKKKQNNLYLVLLPTFTALFYIMQHEMGLPDIASGIVTGAGFGLAVLAIIVTKKETKGSVNIKQNIKRKLLNN